MEIESNLKFGIDLYLKTAIFAECKWTNEKVDVGVLELLEKRAGMFNYKNTYLYLFAKSGFTKGCIDRAGKIGKVRLVSYKILKKRCSFHNEKPRFL